MTEVMMFLMEHDVTEIDSLTVESDLLKIEYLPLPLMGLYFDNKRVNPDASKKRSQFVMKAFFHITSHETL